jgi:hypothetical protein
LHHDQNFEYYLFLNLLSIATELGKIIWNKLLLAKIFLIALIIPKDILNEY